MNQAFLPSGSSLKKSWRCAALSLVFAVHHRIRGVVAGVFDLALASSGMVGFAGFGRTAASLINLVLLIIPLMALTIGAQSLSGEMERGTMGYLLAQPVGRFEVFLGKYLGLALSLLASLAMGFGISGLVMALSGSGAADPSAYVTLVLLAFLLSLAMLSVGFLISADLQGQRGCRHWPVPVAGLCLPGRPGHDGHLHGAARTYSQPAADVISQSVAGLQDGGDPQHQRHLGILGLAGIYALQRYGQSLLVIFLGVLALWAIVPAALAYLRFAARGDF